MTLAQRPVITSATERPSESWEDASRGTASWFTFFSSDMTPTSAMCAGMMELQPNGGTLQPHRHSQAEIYFVAGGTGILTIDGVETTLTTGNAAFIPGDAEHALRNEQDAVLKIFYVFPASSFAEIVYRFSSG